VNPLRGVARRVAEERLRVGTSLATHQGARALTAIASPAENSANAEHKRIASR